MSSYYQYISSVVKCLKEDEVRLHKVIFFGGKYDKELRKEAQTIINTQKTLKHESIQQIYDCVLSEDQFDVIMEPFEQRLYDF